jgi:hypothetical protein
VSDLADLDLDDVFVGSDTGSKASAVVEAPSFEVEWDHWKVSSALLMKSLRTMLTFPASATVILALWREGDTVCLHANNKDAFIDAVLPIENTKQVYRGEEGRVYFLDSKLLAQFVASYSNFVFSFDAKGQIYFQSPYALTRLEVLRLDFKALRISVEGVDNWIAFPLAKSEVDTFKKLFDGAIRQSDNKMLLTSEKFEAFYTVWKFTIKNGSKFTTSEPLVLRKLDLPVISEFMGVDSQIGYTASRIYFKNSLGIISFLRLHYVEKDFMYPATLSSGAEVGRFAIDPKQLGKAMRLLTLFNAHSVEFSQKDDSVLLSVPPRVEFVIGSGSLSGSVILAQDTFSKVVNTLYGDASSVNVVVTEGGTDFIISGSMEATWSLSRASADRYVLEQKARDRLEGKKVTEAPSDAPLTEQLADDSLFLN